MSLFDVAYDAPYASACAMLMSPLPMLRRDNDERA